MWAENWGLCPFGEGVWVPIKHDMVRAKAYLRAKFHLDLSNRLATVHQRYRQDKQDSTNRTGQTDNGLIA